MSQPDFNDPEFLRGQLSLAVSELRSRDRTKAEIIERLEAQYADQYEEIRLSREKMRESYGKLERELRQVTLRYSVLRLHQVRVRDLGLVAKGKNLDSALDAIIEKMGVPALEPSTVEAGVAKALREALH